MKYFIDLSYKGTNYHGWQIQTNAPSVQETIEKALKTILRHEVTTLGSGRTDTGVHAMQQYMQFETENLLSNKTLISLNGVLPKDIVVNSLYYVAENASARFDALSRSYEYHINQKQSPFAKELSCFFPKKIDLDLMNEAAAILLNHVDFQCFSKVKTTVEHFGCIITEAYFEQNDNKIVFHITANRFLRGMVRAIVGTLLNVGLQKTTIEQFEAIILSKDRRNAGMAAPPDGLYLSKVIYPDGFLRPIE